MPERRSSAPSPSRARQMGRLRTVAGILARRGRPGGRRAARRPRALRARLGPGFRARGSLLGGSRRPGPRPDRLPGGAGARRPAPARGGTTASSKLPRRLRVGRGVRSRGARFGGGWGGTSPRTRVGRRSHLAHSADRHPRARRPGPAAARRPRGPERPRLRGDPRRRGREPRPTRSHSGPASRCRCLNHTGGRRAATQGYGADPPTDETVAGHGNDASTIKRPTALQTRASRPQSCQSARAALSRSSKSSAAAVGCCSSSRVSHKPSARPSDRF